MLKKGRSDAGKRKERCWKKEGAMLGRSDNVKGRSEVRGGRSGVWGGRNDVGEGRNDGEGGRNDLRKEGAMM